MPLAMAESRLWCAAGRCQFCDQLIVWVERPNRQPRKDYAIHLGSWDGNPVYNPYIHRRHRCRLRRKLLALRGDTPRFRWFS